MNRKQFATIQNKCCKPKKMKYGVSQGSITPITRNIFFIIYKMFTKNLYTDVYTDYKKSVKYF